MPEWNNYLARGAPVKDSDALLDRSGTYLEACPADELPLIIGEPLPEAPPPPERVLIVEDDEAIRRMYRLVLERRGLDVVEAADGQEALLYAATQAFDLVVADLNMPRIDGWGLLSRLREDCRTRDVPVAFLSCENDLREALRGAAVGAQAYISKGTRLELIAQEVQLLCEPVRRIRRALRCEKPESVPTGTVGPLALLREVAVAGWDGTLRVTGQWASIELTFSAGVPVRADATSGQYRAQGPIAFNAFIGCSQLEGLLTPQKMTVEPNLPEDTQRLIQEAVAVANGNLARARALAMIQPAAIQVNATLYRLYQQLATPEARDTARLACELKLTPAEVIRDSDRSPIEVEQELQELARRGVVQLHS